MAAPISTPAARARSQSRSRLRNRRHRLRQRLQRSRQPRVRPRRRKPPMAVTAHAAHNELPSTSRQRLTGSRSPRWAWHLRWQEQTSVWWTRTRGRRPRQPAAVQPMRRGAQARSKEGRQAMTRSARAELPPERLLPNSRSNERNSGRCERAPAAVALATSMEHKHRNPRPIGTSEVSRISYA